MAKFKTSLLGGSPIVSKFEFDQKAFLESNLSSLRFEEYSNDWLDFVIANREGKASVSYDFIYGPIADDKVGLQLLRYKDGTINKRELLRRLKYHKGITFQYFFGTPDALKFLKKL